MGKRKQITVDGSNRTVDSEKKARKSKDRATPSIESSITTPLLPTTAPDALKVLDQDAAGSSTLSTTTTATITISTTTTIAKGDGSTPTPSAPIRALPRIAMSSGFVPRQVARQPTKPRSQTSASFKSSSSSSSKPAPTATVKIASQDTRPIFRAKDILQQWVPTPSGSLDFGTNASVKQGSTAMGPKRRQMFQRSDGESSGRPLTTMTAADGRRKAWTVASMHEEEEKSGRRDTQLSSNSTAQAHSITTTTTADTIIHAEPIVVYLENRPYRKEYPYGNYPQYYERRVEDQQTKTIPSSSSSSTTPQSSTQPPARQQQQQQKSHRRFKTKPSVLFPRWNDSSDGQEKHNAMSLKELAKSVDLRIEFLDPSWFRGKRVLDIGCNAALLTVFIAVHYKPSKIQGVDIDPSLIGKAQNFVLKTFSQISPQAYTQTRGGGGGDGNHNNHNNRDGNGKEKTEAGVRYEEYFPKSMHRIHGFLPVPKRTRQTEALFPHNIELRVADWVTEEAEDRDEADAAATTTRDSGAEQWDVILGFSLAKWIHLHHGDAGLKRFFQKVYCSLAPGGLFLLEPQAFDTYRKRSKLAPAMEENYKAIALKPEAFREYLLSDEVGFREAQHLGHSDGAAKNFNRDIFLFRK